MHGSTARLVALVCTLAAMAVFPAMASAQGQTTLDVTRSGLQLGTVTDSGGQITCGVDCSGTYNEECTLENQHGACIQWGAASTTLTTTVPSGFQPVWSRACVEGSSNGADCTMVASGSVNVHFDDITAPTVSLTSPTAGTRRGVVTLTATAGDGQTGVQRVEFRVGGGLVNTDSSAPYTFDFNTASRADGPTSVVARAFNNDGDFADSTAVSITIDNTLPNLGLSGPDGQTFGPGSTQTWMISASDTTSGLASVQCSVVATGSPPAFGPCSGGTTAHSVTNKPEGNYTFTARAIDNAGNQRDTTRTFSVDATAPETSIDIGPADGSSSSATSYTFGFSAGEAGSSFECRVYPAALTPPAFGPCSGGGSHTASGFAPGTYTFEVVATDAFGNSDATPAKRTFTVTPPDATTPPPPPPPPPPPAADTTAPAMGVGSRTITASRARVLGVKVTCPASEPGGCTGKLALVSDKAFASARKRVSLGTATFKIAGGKTAVVKVRLSRAGQRLLKRLGRVRARLTVTASDTAGNSATKTVLVTVKAARRR